MEPVKHSSNNLKFGKPESMTDEQCVSINVTAHKQLIGEQQFTTLTSFWQPTSEEIEAIVKGGLVMLSILSTQLPPVMVNVTLDK